MSLFRRHVKEGSWIVLGQIISVAGSLVLVRILTEYLDPAQYGQLALGLTITVVVNQVIMSGVSPGISRFYSIAAERGDLGGYLRCAVQLMGYATFVVLIVGSIAILGLVGMGQHQFIGLVMAAIFLSLIDGYNASISGLQNAARQRGIVAFHSGLGAWLKITSVFIVAKIYEVSSTAVLVGYIVSSAVVTISQVFFLRKTVPAGLPIKAIYPAWSRQMAAYSMPFAAWGVFSCGQQISDRWALEALASTDEVGRYVLVFQLGYSPILLLVGLATNFVGPILFQRSGDATDKDRNNGVRQLAWRMSQGALVLTSVCFMTTVLLHGTLFRFLASAEFRDTSYLLPWFILAGGVYGASEMLALKLMSDMKSRAMLIAKILTSIVAIALNLVGAYVAGIHGLVAALVAFSFLSFIWMAVLNRRISTHKLEVSIE